MFPLFPTKSSMAISRTIHMENPEKLKLKKIPLYQVFVVCTINHIKSTLNTHAIQFLVPIVDDFANRNIFVGIFVFSFGVIQSKRCRYTAKGMKYTTQTHIRTYNNISRTRFYYKICVPGPLGNKLRAYTHTQCLLKSSIFRFISFSGYLIRPCSAISTMHSCFSNAR